MASRMFGLTVGATAVNPGTHIAAALPSGAASIARAEINHPAGTTTTVIQEVGTTAAITGASAGNVSLNGTRINVFCGDTVPAHSQVFCEVEPSGYGRFAQQQYAGIRG